MSSIVVIGNDGDLFAYQLFIPKLNYSRSLEADGGLEGLPDPVSALEKIDVRRVDRGIFHPDADLSGGRRLNRVMIEEWETAVFDNIYGPHLA